MDLFNRVIKKWTNASVAQKSIVIVMLSSLILSSLLLFRWATKVEYAPLFVNMQSQNAGEVVEKLKGINVPYRLTDAGRTIMVPKDQVYELRLSLASEGVFSESGSGFELFDSSNLGVTDFERHLNYLRALQEELRRTIVQLNAVEQARVHLVLPEPSVFVEEEKKSSASIVLKLRPMAKLQQEQVQGIVEFVANSVDNLAPEDVNLIDTEGNVLNKFSPEKGFKQLGMTQQEMKEDFERNLEQRIQFLLEKMWGSGQVVTMVTADLDFNQKEVTRIIWGDEGVVTSEQTIQRKGTTSSGYPFAVGEENRETELFPDTFQDEDITSADIEEIRNYEINRTEEREIFAPGRLISLSTAVAVDGELSFNKEEQIRDIVTAAIGFNQDRGDQINIISMDFDKSQSEAAEKAMEKLATEEKRQMQIDKWISWGTKGIVILLAFILGLLVIRTLHNFLNRAELPEVERPTPVHVIEEKLQPEEKPDLEKEHQVKEIVEKEPDVAAQIINNWLEEGRNGPEK